MKKIVTAGISAIIGLSVLGASLSTPACAGKKERRIAAGMAIGAITGLFIAGELSRRTDRGHYRKRDRHFRNHHRPPRPHRLQRGRYLNEYDRNESTYQPDRKFDDHAIDYRHEPQVTKHSNKRISKKSSGHIQRCTKAYRSYDPQSDTYIGYDGKERICRK